MVINTRYLDKSTVFSVPYGVYITYHYMTKKDNKELIHRFSKIEGQISAIKKSLSDENKQNCKDIVSQIKASRNALKNAAVIYVSEYMEDCIKDENDKKSRAEKIKEAMNMLSNV